MIPPTRLRGRDGPRRSSFRCWLAISWAQLVHSGVRRTPKPQESNRKPLLTCGNMKLVRRRTMTLEVHYSTLTTLRWLLRVLPVLFRLAFPAKPSLVHFRCRRARVGARTNTHLRATDPLARFAGNNLKISLPNAVGDKLRHLGTKRRPGGLCPGNWRKFWLRFGRSGLASRVPGVAPGCGRRFWLNCAVSLGSLVQSRLRRCWLSG